MTLQTASHELKAENAYLKNLILDKWGDEAMEPMRRDSKITPAERLIAAIQKPGSKRLNKSTLTFLQSFTDTVRNKMQ